jgi:bifunctional non-homologous end joining protein LigD
LHFVIQKHQARALHYDFRLEMGGVMKSWAVPKEPSRDPRDKRLAIQTEDHPVAYRFFEGRIPEGNYGAGEVAIWDEGTYTPSQPTAPEERERVLAGELKKGQLHIRLQGKKLKGDFALIRVKGKNDKSWLLIKKNEARRVPPRSPAAHRSQRAFSPMLATLVDAPFDKPGWLFEIKWDGYRAIAEIRGGKARLYSRNRKALGDKYPEVQSALGRLGIDAVLDGEIVALDSEGKSSFQLLQNHPRTGKGELVYYVFDLLFLGGQDLRALPLIERKKRLREILPEAPGIRFSDHVEGKGVSLFRAMQRRGLEGLIAKQADSPYREGARSGEWLKIKTQLRQEAIICGFTAPRRSRKHFGSLLLAVYEGGALHYVGHVGTGFSQESLRSLHQKLIPLRRGASPLPGAPKIAGSVTWVDPVLVCEVSFHEWTQDGIMRQPSFQGLREDKPPTEVTRERSRRLTRVLEKQPPARLHPVPSPEQAQCARRLFSPKGITALRRGIQEIDAEPGAVRVTHLDKVFFPQKGYTKEDTVNYYRQIASVILPYLKGRPQSLHRQPQGITDAGFYQKDVTHRLPEWVRTSLIPSETDGQELRYVVCDNESTLLYLANLGCIELHPWNSRLDRLPFPDYLVIDLDPLAISFERVVETAIEVRSVLDSIEAPSYCKTSGKKGLHIYVPLGARHEYQAVRQFAEIVCRLVHEKLPHVTSLERDPRRRKARVYLDYLRNAIGQTTAAPYSLRPEPLATVSTPLEWAEVRRHLDPRQFTIQSLCRRLDKKGDLFAGVLRASTDPLKGLERLAAA